MYSIRTPPKSVDCGGVL